MPPYSAPNSYLYHVRRLEEIKLTVNIHLTLNKINAADTLTPPVRTVSA